VLFAADAVVAASKASTELLNTSRTHAVVNTTSAPVADFVLNRDLDFSNDSVASAIKKQVQSADHFHVFSKIAEELTGDSISTNMLMLGYAWQQGLLPISLDALQQAITLNGVAVESNIKALTWGRQLAAQPEEINKLMSANESPLLEKPQSINELIEHRAEHLRAYQGNKLAKKFKQKVDAMQRCIDERGIDTDLLKTFVHSYARILSYKDEYEVSRLYSMPSFKQQLADQFDGDYALQFNLAPPMLGGVAPNGRPKKRAMGPWVLKLFGLLKRGKVLRGTPFDPFGYTKERRLERDWIKRYEQDVQRIQAELNQSNADIAEQLLAIPDDIRGFGPVKLEAMQAAEERRTNLWRDFDAPTPIDLTVAA